MVTFKLSQHRRVIFEYDTKGSDFIAENRQNNACAVAAAATKPSTLFDNLDPDCRPIATKSRRFNSQDREFIKDEIDKLLSAGIIKPSRSPWRAQVLVVTNSKSEKKRMCVDYSKTINLFTNLDAHSLPRIDDLVTKLATHNVFSKFSLKSAYQQQIPIEESQKVYRLLVSKLEESSGISAAFHLISRTGFRNFSEKWMKLLKRQN